MSNWARTAAARSRHNVLYWRDANWWGSAGAHSHVGGVRWWNVKHPARYDALLEAGAAQRPGARRSTERRGSPSGSCSGVRLREGLDLRDLPRPSRAKLPQLVTWGLAEPTACREGRLALTQRGRLLADAVVRELLG